LIATFGGNTRKLKLKTLPPFLEKRPPKSLHNSLSGAGSKFIKKKREHGIDE
jgi:hypothetical protein